MKVEFEELSDVYDSLDEIINNQLEIFSNLRTAINDFISTEEFKGETADKIKSYFEEMHLEIISSLESVLMSINAKVYKLNEDFSNNVDNSSVAILDTEYINGKKTNIETQKSNWQEVNSDFNTVLKSVSDIFVPINEYGKYDNDMIDSFDGAIDKCKKSKKAVTDFNDDHKNDMNNIDTSLSNIKSMISKMEGMLSSSGCSYVKGQALTYKEIKALKEFQIEASEEVIEKIPSGMDKYANTLGNLGTVGGILVSTYGIGLDAKDVKKLYSAGIKWDVVKNGDNVIFKISSKTGDMAAIQKALREAGLSNLKYKKIEEIMNGGLKVVEDGNLVNKKIARAIFNSNALSSKNNVMINNLDNVDDLAKFEKVTKFKKVADMAGKAGTVITVGVNVYSDVYNPDTGEWEVNADTVSDVVIDSSVDIGVDAGITWGCTAVGTAICPGVGTAIGAGVGVVASFVASGCTWGEPPKSITDHIKDGAKKVKDKVVDWVKKVFW